jgi:hypothetical protein
MSLCSSWIGSFKEVKDLVNCSGCIVGLGDGEEDMDVVGMIKVGEVGTVAFGWSWESSEVGFV